MGWPKVKVTQVGNFPHAWAAAADPHDLCIVDLIMPGAGPVEGVAGLLDTAPDMRVLVVTGTEDDTVMLSLLDKGIAGFVSKSASTGILDAAIRLVLAGGRYLPPRLATIAASQIHRGEVAPVRDQSAAIANQLTLRQHSVLRLVADGRTNKEIGRLLGVAPSTVKTHLEQIMRALGAANRADTVRTAYETGILMRDHK
jgi:DNA-binding NarL/FixJ family response regulator